MPEFTKWGYQNWQWSKIFAHADKREDILVFKVSPNFYLTFQPLPRISMMFHGSSMGLTHNISSCWPEPSSKTRIIFIATCWLFGYNIHRGLNPPSINVHFATVNIGVASAVERVCVILFYEAVEVSELGG